MTQTSAADTKPEDAPPADAQQDEQASVEVSDAELTEAPPAGSTASGGRIDILLDTKVKITVALGSAMMPVRQLLELGPGAILPLDRAAGEPVDLYLNDIPFATGALVCIGERLGVRIKEILRPAREDALEPQS